MTTTDASLFDRSSLASEESPLGPEGSSVDHALLLTPEEAGRRLSIGRTTIYSLMATASSLR